MNSLQNKFQFPTGFEQLISKRKSLLSAFKEENVDSTKILSERFGAQTPNLNSSMHQSPKNLYLQRILACSRNNSALP
ncbi:MAG: hypothetical protein J7K36_00135 [Archaeoglobaceae archaeon]|nr:hypothetical protein [Archaeoglobaceae archaeon]